MADEVSTLMHQISPTLSWRAQTRERAGKVDGRHLMARLDPAVKLLVPAALALFLLLALHSGSLMAYGRLLRPGSYTSLLPGLGAGCLLALLSFQVLRTVLWALYKPFPLPEAPDSWPTVTVVIPAFNEGAMVGAAIAAVAASDYPAGKLEILCIDDGSRDDTWQHIAAARRRFPHLVRAFRFARNRGKKEALYAGFTRGTGEVFVTVDSDSILEPAALRHLIAPLLLEPRIGAVAGNVKVFNRHTSLMGKMQGVRFVNLDYLRASQSWYRTVVCTPGSLSAYRRTALKPHLAAWRRQTFLGAPCHHSEDRALTNFILRAGHYTCYQRTAVVYTLVPETYRGVVRMYLRWERGNVRESVVQLGYLFTAYRSCHRVLPVVEFFLAQLEYPLTLIFLGVLSAAIAAQPPLLLKFLALLGVGSLLNLSYYLWLERDLEFVYGVIYSYYAFFFLQWIYPYAVFTVRDRRWLTR